MKTEVDASDVLSYIEENEPVSLAEVDREFGDDVLQAVHTLREKGFVKPNLDWKLETTT
jgi:chromosome segregation and condensation protein ScpB